MNRELGFNFGTVSLNGHGGWVVSDGSFTVSSNVVNGDGTPDVLNAATITLPPFPSKGKLKLSWDWQLRNNPNDALGRFTVFAADGTTEIMALVWFATGSVFQCFVENPSGDSGNVPLPYTSFQVDRCELSYDGTTMRFSKNGVELVAWVTDGAPAGDVGSVYFESSHPTGVNGRYFLSNMVLQTSE